PSRHLHSFPTRRSSDLTAWCAGDFGSQPAPNHSEELSGVVERCSKAGQSGTSRPSPHYSARTERLDSRCAGEVVIQDSADRFGIDRKSTRLNSSHRTIS